MVPKDLPHPALKVMIWAVQDPHPPRDWAASREVQNWLEAGWAVALHVPELALKSAACLVVCLRGPEYAAGAHGKFGSGGTVGAFGGLNAAAKASILAFLLRMAT